MRDGGIAMWPEYFYMSGLGKIAYVVLYLPAVLIFLTVLYRFWLRLLPIIWLRRSVMLLLTLFFAAAPWLEVYYISVEAQRLCRSQAGLHVYRVVDAEGFLEAGGIGYWSKYGFKYVESGGGTTRLIKYRETMQDGKAVTREVHEYISRYESRTGDSHVVVGKYFARSSEQVIDRQTNEVLGELVHFSIFPGLLDSIAIGLTGLGSGFNPWSCGNEAPPGHKDRLGSNDVVLATIKPVSE